jgi:Uma2 family endonuclease
MGSNRIGGAQYFATSRVGMVMHAPRGALRWLCVPSLPSTIRRDELMGMAAPMSWTAEMVRALPDDGNRHEVVDGELLVTPSPNDVHQRAVAALLFELMLYTRTHRFGEALTAPADIELDPNGMVQPDVFVQGLVNGRVSPGWNSGAPLMLVIEVLSPSTAKADRTTKRRRFQRAGIPEYWIADTDSRVIERWRPADTRPEVLAETISWHPVSAAAPLVIDVPLLFARAHGEAL